MNAKMQTFYFYPFGTYNYGVLQSRLGPRQLPAHDARNKLDRIYMSELLEEQGTPGPACFGHRIMREPPVLNFQLAPGTKSYDDSTKPKDWLTNYVTAVHIAGGNRRWAVRYIPQMLEGSARIWLKNLPENIIDCWLDFSDAIVSNFTSTYKRPNHPQQLSMCRQRDDETDRDYLTRWSTIRNSCEGVIESQAITWFAQGCRHGTMLWQRFQREMPATLAETIKIADMYALGDPTHPMLTSVEPSKAYPANDGVRSYRRNDRQDPGNKRREDRPDYRYGSNKVAAVDQNQPDAGNSQRQKSSGTQWGQKQDDKKQWSDQKKPWEDRPRFTSEMMMDGPCSYHTPHPSKPANHTTRQCSWYQRIAREGGNSLPPSSQQDRQLPLPLTGANTQALNAPPKPVENRRKPENVNQVDNQANNNNAGASRRNEYQEHHQSYMVFVTEPTKKQSKHRRAMEVNAVMPAVPKFMYWSEDEINWSIKDHPKVMPSLGGYALVVDPTLIGPDINVKFTRVLIDNGSSINILYRDTMLKLGITDNMLQPSRTTFHGIAPGVSCAPMGKVGIDVLFGTRENLQFEVVDLESP